MNQEIAVLFGGTGLIGGYVLKTLLQDSSFEKVIVVTRNSFRLSHPKLKVKKIDFYNLKEYEECIKNSSIVFSSIGTTASKVRGNQDKYRQIDLDINHNIGSTCKKLDIKKFLVISSSGANINSSNFYLKLKGDIEKCLQDLRLNSLVILQPSLLLGPRKEFRFGERLAQILMPIISIFLPSNIKPVQAELVARIMVFYSKSNERGNRIISNSEIIGLKNKIGYSI